MRHNHSTLQPLKSNWQSVWHEYIQSHPGRIIIKYTFSGLFSKAWLNTNVPTNIIGGLKHCGVYPLNPRTVLDHDPCIKVPNTNKITEILQEDSAGEVSHIDKATNPAGIAFTYSKSLSLILNLQKATICMIQSM